VTTLVDHGLPNDSPGGQDAAALPIGVRELLAGASSSIVIDGHRQPSASGESQPSYDPATGGLLAHIAAGSAVDIDRAVRSADLAFRTHWRDLSAAARSRILLRLADLVEENCEELATLESLDNGKPLTEATYVDLALCAEVYRYYGGWPTKVHGDVLPVSPLVGEALVYTRREPLGVVGAIVPWNFPMLLTAWKVAPALAAGNAVVLKPSELTSLTSIRLAELALEAGLPPGVLNVVTGLGGEAGAALAAHPGLSKISFTGSTVTGRSVMTAAAQNLTPVVLELGGKSPNIIFADADLDTAVQGALLGIFMNQGQVCCAGSRAMVQQPVYDEVLERLTTAARQLRLGPGLADDTDMGPLVSAGQRDRVMGYIASGVEEGARLVTGGTAGDGAGYFVEPTIFTDVRDDMVIAQEEIFGPVLAVTAFTDEDEAIRRANATRYGLAAGIWTQNLRRAHRTAALLEAGTVWINAYNMIDPTAPFGGVKDSGFGRDLGPDAMHAYTAPKTVWVGLD